MAEFNQDQARARERFTLPHLATDLQHLPGQTETFINALAAFVSDQSDPTGLKVYNLVEMAKNLRTTYERIESMLQSYDKPPQGKDQFLNPVKEPVKLKNGRTVYAEVNGRTLDGKQGSILLEPETGASTLEEWITNSTIIDVKRNDAGQWEEL